MFVLIDWNYEYVFLIKFIFFAWNLHSNILMISIIIVLQYLCVDCFDIIEYLHVLMFFFPLLYLVPSVYVLCLVSLDWVSESVFLVIYLPKTQTHSLLSLSLISHGILCKYFACIFVLSKTYNFLLLIMSISRFEFFFYLSIYMYLVWII